MGNAFILGSFCAKQQYILFYQILFYSLQIETYFDLQTNDKPPTRSTRAFNEKQPFVRRRKGESLVGPLDFSSDGHAIDKHGNESPKVIFLPHLFLCPYFLGCYVRHLRFTMVIEVYPHSGQEFFVIFYTFCGIILS